MSQDFVVIVILWDVVFKDQVKNHWQNVWKQRFEMEMVE